jgi:nucleoside-diphosphate-sugar epimerase
MGTVNLTEALKAFCPNLKRFVIASSMETFGHQPEMHKTFTPFNEQTPQNAACPYAVAKIGAETYVKYLNYAYKFPGVSLRQTNTYGRRDNDYFVAEAFIVAMLKNSKEVNFGNPKPVRNFLYIDDLTDLYLTLFNCKNQDILGQSFTIGPPNGITIEKLAEMIAQKLNWKGKINWYTREIRDGEIYYLNSDNKKITEMTGWKPKVGLSEGLDKTINHWKNKLEVEQW